MISRQICFLFILAIALGRSIRYSSTQWEKVGDGNLTIIDQYVPLGKGSISSFELTSNILKFSMEGTSNNISTQALISVYAFLPQVLFDGSKISEHRLDNIPIGLFVYLRSPSSQSVNQQPEKIAIESITIEFSQSKNLSTIKTGQATISISQCQILFYVQGSTYTLDLTITTAVQHQTGQAFLFTFLFNLFFLPNMWLICTFDNWIWYRFYTLYNTMAGYEIFVVLNYHFEHIKRKQDAYLYILCVFLGSLLILIVIMLLPPTNWKKRVLGLPLFAYSMLISLGYIGETFILSEIILQQLFITLKNATKKQQDDSQFIGSVDKQMDLFLQLILVVSISKLLIIEAVQILSDKLFDYRIIPICLLLLILITSETYFTINNRNLFRRIRAMLRKPNIRQPSNQELS